MGMLTSLCPCIYYPIDAKVYKVVKLALCVCGNWRGALTAYAVQV